MDFLWQKTPEEASILTNEDRDNFLARTMERVLQLFARLNQAIDTAIPLKIFIYETKR